MKSVILFFLFLSFSGTIFAQAVDVQPLGIWTDTTIHTSDGLRFSDCWGFVHDGVEYAVIGSTEGMHIIDLSDPADLKEADFVPGGYQGYVIHRDYKTYDHYIYAVCDEGSTSTLQVVDYSYLPDSVHLVYDSNEFVITAHDCWVDTSAAKLYLCGSWLASLIILDLAENPASPSLLANANSFANEADIPYSHDLYVRNDTAFLNCGPEGLYVADVTDPDSIQLLGTMSTYPQSGYNHSGWWDAKGEYYYLADETHGKALKAVATTDFSDMSVVSLFDANSVETSIPHNLIWDKNLVFSAYYYDGLQVFDVSDPTAPERIAYHDTYSGEDGLGYHGAWGIYPLLPSGRILLSDIESGLFVFEPITASIVDIQDVGIDVHSLAIFPNPSSDKCTVTFAFAQAKDAELEVIDDIGRVLIKRDLGYTIVGEQSLDIDISDLPFGKYLIQIHTDSGTWQGYVLKQ